VTVFNASPAMTYRLAVPSIFLWTMLERKDKKKEKENPE